jgi:hypothetical protein
MSENLNNETEYESIEEEREISEMMLDMEEFKPSKVGDYICGIFKKILSGKGVHKGNMIVILAKEISQDGKVQNFKEQNGKVLYLWEKKTIKKAFEDKEIKEGDDIKIVYEGLKTSANKKKYHMFFVLKAKNGGVE